MRIKMEAYIKFILMVKCEVSTDCVFEIGISFKMHLQKVVTIACDFFCFI